MIKGKKGRHARGRSQTYNYRENDKETNSRVYKLRRRQALTSCSYCPPHGGENARRQERPSKYKLRRKNKL